MILQQKRQRQLSVSSSPTTRPTGNVERSQAQSSLAGSAIIRRATSSMTTAEVPMMPVKPSGVHRRIRIFCGLIVVLGSIAAAAFATLGVTSNLREQSELFDRKAAEIINSIYGSLKNYESTGLYTHNACQDGISRLKFRELYENIVSTGLNVRLISCNPNVTHAQRSALEEEARLYYEDYYPQLRITGEFRGLESVPEAGDMALKVRSNQSFYFPSERVEPIEYNPEAAEFDGYSSPDFLPTIERVLDTWHPALTPRIEWTTSTGSQNEFSVVLMHPGIPLSTRPNLRPRDFAGVTLRISDLLLYAMGKQLESTKVFIYDTSGDIDPKTSFLGGATTKIKAEGGVEEFIVEENEISLEDLRRSTQTMLRQTTITRLSRQWTVVVIAIPGTYQANHSFIISGSVIIFMACVGLAVWLFTSMKIQGELHYIQALKEAEKAVIVVEEAQKAAQLERELNDFIAHEVRNPLSAALSACNFVSTTIRDESQPLFTKSDRQPVLDDVHIINSSLTFINDLLRNMLDMQRAKSNQLRVEMAPTDVFRDILMPVDAMLYQRGSLCRVEVECEPPSLIVSTDRMRLKQIMLNLARNACKFVEKGFVRLYAKCVNNNVVLSVEDSGPGIPQEKRKKLFAKFQESLDSLNQGTGIGLCLCLQLTELMGAKVWLDESYDSGIEGQPGSRFVVDLQRPPLEFEADFTARDPVLVEDREKQLDMSEGTCRTEIYRDDSTILTVDLETGIAPLDTPPPAYPLPGQLPESLSVLFVDDDFVLRKLFSRAVRKAQPTWNVQEAANGESALRIVEEQSFDVIFMDQYMTSVEKQLLGTETVRALRARGVQSRICGLSANDMEESFLEAGADAFMIKPFPCDKESLTREFKRVMSLPS